MAPRHSTVDGKTRLGRAVEVRISRRSVTPGVPRGITKSAVTPPDARSPSDGEEEDLPRSPPVTKALTPVDDEGPPRLQGRRARTLARIGEGRRAVGLAAITAT